MTPEKVSLAFNDLAQGGSSDKVYHLELSYNQAGWKVEGQYGRRGSALMSQVKCSASDYERAKKVFDKVKREKIAKGYIVEGTAPAPQVAPSGVAVDIKPPELLEEVVNGDHLNYVNDPAYWMQDKSDGHSCGVLKQAGEIFGINKQGQPRPLPAEIVEELNCLFLEKFQLDAELVGARLVCRDILVCNEDISHEPYFFRFGVLKQMVENLNSSLVCVVANWEGDEKAPALARARLERREGVVFKLRSAPYRPGRNGQHKKYKFIKTLSAIAGKPNATGKESVELFLYNVSEEPCKECQYEQKTGKAAPCTHACDVPLVRCGTVSLIGKPKVNEGDIVEVAYLYAQPSGLLSQARLLNVRTDVAAEECTTAQLIFKREEAE